MVVARVRVLASADRGMRIVAARRAEEKKRRGMLDLVERGDQVYQSDKTTTSLTTVHTFHRSNNEYMSNMVRT